MMNRKNRVVTTLAVFAVVLCSAFRAGAQTYTSEVDGVEWQYTLAEDKATISGISGAKPLNVKVPDKLDGYEVVAIGNSSFSYYTTMESVYVPASVKTIGQSTFTGCYALKNVVLEEGLVNIAGWTFQDCSALESITIPSTVVSIGSLTFHRCSKLVNVTFVGDRNAIDMDVLSVFDSTPWIEAQPFELVIGKAYNNLRGFLGVCPETVVIPEGVTSINSESFRTYYHPSATNLVSIVLPSTLNLIGSYAFSGCSNIKEITIPSSVYTIEQGAFSWCKSLASVTIEDEDRYEQFLARFKGTPFFDSLPFRLRYGFTDVFGGTTLLIIDYVGKCPRELNIQEIMNKQWEEQRQRELQENGYDIGDILPISSIDNEAFFACDIKSVTLPESLKRIENSAFTGCNIERLTLPQSIEYIGNYAFSSCTNLQKIAFNGNAPELGDWAFGSVYATVYVPANSTGWGVEIPGTWMDMDIFYSTGFNVENGVLVSAIPGQDTAVTLPGNVTNIAPNAFSECSTIERVTIPESVTSIAPTAFDGCDKLWAKWFKTLERLSETDNEVVLTVTNVVVHYVMPSAQSEGVSVPNDTGIVNIISEVSAESAIAISQDWAAQYPNFVEKFGSDFSKALTMTTGKRDSSGNAMQVWQDFVAGTDPTDINDVFIASIAFDAAGNPVINHSPVLSEEEAAKRTYTTYGKVSLTDAEWTPVASGEEKHYNFFKVSVRMK